jgi:hypothetical protein
VCGSVGVSVWGSVWGSDRVDVLGRICLRRCVGRCVGECVGGCVWKNVDEWVCGPLQNPAPTRISRSTATNVRVGLQKIEHRRGAPKSTTLDTGDV